MVTRIVEEEIVGNNFRILDTEFLPSLSSPNGLAQIFPCKMWAGGVVGAPFAGFLSRGGIVEGFLELVV